MPFHIGREERARWLEHMTAAIDVAVADLDEPLAEAVRAELLGYFVPASEQLRNDTGLPISSPRQ